MCNANRVRLALVLSACCLIGCHPYRQVQRLETENGWTVVVEMEEYDDGPAAAMLGTVFTETGEAIQPGMAVGASYDRRKVGGFGLYEVNEIVGLFAEEEPRDILILFDYKGNIWPKYADDPEALRDAHEWYNVALVQLLDGVEKTPLTTS